MELLQSQDDVTDAPDVSCSLVHQIAQISLFSNIGTICRIMISFQHTSLPAVIYPQMLGTLIIGIVTNSVFFINHPYLKTGIATGLCGSITSFSGFLLETYLTFQTGFGNGLIIILQLICLSFGSYMLGKHIGIAINFQTYPTLLEFKLLAILVAIMNYSGILIWCFLANSSFHLALALLVSPLGSISRFLLSKSFPIRKQFPIGTFLGNFIVNDSKYGCMCLAVHPFSAGVPFKKL